MSEDDIKLIDKWFDEHAENYGTSHYDNEYAVCAYDLKDFSDFLQNNFPDMIGLRCYFGKGDSAIWFFKDDLESMHFI